MFATPVSDSTFSLAISSCHTHRNRLFRRALTCHRPAPLPLLSPSADTSVDFREFVQGGQKVVYIDGVTLNGPTASPLLPFLKKKCGDESDIDGNFVKAREGGEFIAPV